MRNEFIAFAVFSVVLTVLLGQFVSYNWYFLLLILGPLIILGFYDMFQSKHAIMRNFPILGRGRYIMEDLRPKIYQYFIENETDGTPISRNHRSIVYQRAKKELETIPFGTQLNTYEEGYQFVGHSLNAFAPEELETPKITFGNVECKQPYQASLLNISAMSFGSLSKRAILALNKGAKMAHFAHNTGEGGISPYHLKHGGDLIFQVGTGYFGACDKEGNFSDEVFRVNATLPSVKMIELKLSQGAKPGHGGILPAKKNTREISEIRGVVQGTDVLSPPYHRVFSTPKGLILHINKMRELSDWKPVGFKLCIGKKSEFISICKAMVELDIYPDFISVDGGEGGTGAAPLEFTNSIGMPFLDGLAFVHDALTGFGIRNHVKILASGKIITAFHMMRAFALGADVCYSARAMMLALGCIQALECHKNTCPTGVATQDKELMAGLNVDDKARRVANYHHETIHAFKEMMAATGIRSLNQITRDMISIRMDNNQLHTLEDIYPSMEVDCLLDVSTTPTKWKTIVEQADSETF